MTSPRTGMKRRLRVALLGCGAIFALLALDGYLASRGARSILVAAAKADDAPDSPGSGPGPGSSSDGGRDGSGADNERGRRGPDRKLDKFKWPWENWFPAKKSPPPAAPPPRHAGPPSAVPREIVISGLDAEAVRRLEAERFAIVAQRRFGLQPSLIVRVRVPQGVPMDQAIARARALAPGAAVDRNHLYNNIYVAQIGSDATKRAFPDPLGAVAWPAAAACAVTADLGMVDTGIDRNHPGLKDKQIARETVRVPDLKPSSTEHGTAIAALLLGDGRFAGLVPDARLVAVDAFHRRENWDQADAFDLVSAIDLLVERRVAAINLSLAGKPNELLDRAGKAALAKDVSIVAAAGNDGPAAPPLYPAAYGWAIAVTAIDERRAAYNRANRGPHLDFAAPGVRLVIDDSGGRKRLLSGTSFAAPFVSAAIARLRGANPGLGRADLVDGLTRRVVDLGASGRDTVFGWGLLNMTRTCTLGAAPE